MLLNRQGISHNHSRVILFIRSSGFQFQDAKVKFKLDYALIINHKSVNFTRPVIFDLAHITIHTFYNNVTRYSQEKC